MLHVLAFWFWHPMDEGTGSTCSATNHTGCGYAGWSGWLGSFLTSLPGWFIALAMFLRVHNCHEPRCLKRGALTHQASGTKWCHDHAPDELRDAHPKPHHHWKEKIHAQ